MDDSPLEADLRSATHEAWNRFLAIVEPMRPDLFRYCRRLTGNVWDAEDLIQDTLEQAFARLGTLNADIASPRGYVLRIASNVWISGRRRAELQARATLELAAAADADASARAETTLRLREAAGRIMAQLSPQERAAVVLKDVFGQSLDEIAAVLGTSTGAVKSALHRGRARLEEADAATAPRHEVSRPVLEQFVDRFNARDRAGLMALMLDSAAIRMPGVDYEIGREAFAREPGWLYYNLMNPHSRWEVAVLQDEPVVLVLAKHGDTVSSVMRLQTVDDRIAEIRVYAFCPDAVREVAAAVGRPAAPGKLYRFDPEILHLPE
jgi:RNA polymerase sigma-70 factor (ECF subfamily)